ncbi:MAG: CBS domain-containing protein [Planctomycetaceae bacterium]|nr:CBS domain-containing protein [Planctomycetaceae bacterium]
MQQFPVSNLMRPCQAAAVSEHISVRDAAEAFLTSGQATLVVVDSEGRLCGVVSETAIIRQLMSGAGTLTVSQVMCRHAESVIETAELKSVLHLFRSSCHAVVPVVDPSGAVSGILYRQDVVRLLLDETPSLSAPAIPSGDLNAGELKAGGLKIDGSAPAPKAPYFTRDSLRLRNDIRENL